MLSTTLVYAMHILVLVDPESCSSLRRRRCLRYQIAPDSVSRLANIAVTHSSSWLLEGVSERRSPLLHTATPSRLGDLNGSRTFVNGSPLPKQT